jgi:hypothetical protein
VDPETRELDDRDERVWMAALFLHILLGDDNEG